MKLRFDFKADAWPAASLSFGAPLEVVCAHAIDEVVPALTTVAEAANRGLWAGGYVAYEAAAAFDSAFATHTAFNSPLVWFGIFGSPVDDEGAAPQICMDNEWQASVTRDEYDWCVNEIREAAGRGDLYQANYTFPLCSRIQHGPYLVYRHLQRSSRCSYAAYLDLGDTVIASFSPELFFQFIQNDRTIITRPMKGTRPRGRWLAEDLAAAKTLAYSEKDRAENLMIVDLLRNDLGRVAVHESVQASRLFSIEPYPTVWQMTSTITAKARPDVSLPKLFGALFPCGSVTGAPKIAAMQKIALLERFPRGIYCGAIGMVRPGGDALFSVAIRTVTFDRNKKEASYHVGGGITWDSTPHDEYEEALSKARVLVDIENDFELVETLRLESGAYYLRRRHLDRIAESSSYFERPLDTCAVDNALSECAHAHPEGAWRVRLLVDKSASVRAECTPLAQTEGKHLFRVSQHPVSSKDRFLFHKTTNRKVYENAAEMNGCDEVYDVLLSNEHGEITEFTRGNVAVEIDGAIVTPSRSCGLLNGTFRQEMLANGKMSEQIITLQMLHRADRIWFINSVRGWIEIEQACAVPAH